MYSARNKKIWSSKTVCNSRTQNFKENGKPTNQPEFLLLEWIKSNLDHFMHSEADAAVT
jgi:hypothetical protein